jgi:hypothetical protein
MAGLPSGVGRFFVSGFSSHLEVDFRGNSPRRIGNFKENNMAQIEGGKDGPWTIVYGGGSITTDNAAEAQEYCTPADWTAFQSSLQPTFIAWTAALTTFQGTTPTVGQLNSWLAANPPIAD